MIEEFSCEKKPVFSFQNTQMTADDIENAYNELVSSIERESRRLRQTLAEQHMKDEEERLKKIQVSASERCLKIYSNEYLE